MEGTHGQEPGRHPAYSLGETACSWKFMEVELTPGDLRAAADQLRLHADQLASSLDPVEARAGVDAWIGPAADEFRHELALRRGTLEATAIAVKQLAQRLDARAVALEQHLLEQRLLAEARAETRRGL